MKRAFDLVSASIALVCLLPVIVAVGALVAATSPGPIIFTQRRVGVGCRFFDMYKFRTMRTDAPSEVPTHMMDDSVDYLTPVGRVLRRTSLDELPQLLNIVKGDMSLVGPRPALWNQIDLVEERERRGANDVRPGLTGWAQIHGRDELSIQMKAELDGYYARNVSACLDIKILLLSVGAVAGCRGVVEGGNDQGR